MKTFRYTQKKTPKPLLLQGFHAVLVRSLAPLVAQKIDAGRYHLHRFFAPPLKLPFRSLHQLPAGSAYGRWLHYAPATRIPHGPGTPYPSIRSKLDVSWEEYQPAYRQPLEPTRTKHPTAEKREKKRQQTLAKKRAETQCQNPPDPTKVIERTLITKVPELTS